MDPLMVKTAKLVFECIEKISSTIDWEDDNLGVMREMSEDDYQALKRDFQCDDSQKEVNHG